MVTTMERNLARKFFYGRFGKEDADLARTIIADAALRTGRAVNLYEALDGEYLQGMAEAEFERMLEAA